MGGGGQVIFLVVSRGGGVGSLYLHYVRMGGGVIQNLDDGSNSMSPPPHT